MENCIFCQIIAGKIPANKVYEDGLFLGFLDIHPRVEGHTLLIPKKHFKWVYDVPEFDKYWLAALKITNVYKKIFNTEFVTYGTHGLEVPHAHIHILPRKEEGEFFPNEEYNTTPQELSKLSNSILKII